MTLTRPIQGRVLTEEDIAFVRRLLADHPTWSRNQLSLALAEAWSWRTDTGRLKNFASQSLLLKLDKRGIIRLPPRRHAPAVSVIRPLDPELPWPDPEPITGPLAELMPLSMELLSTKLARYRVLAHYIIRHHYLGLRRSVGENMAYLVHDRQGRDLACLLFGAPAWKAAPRDGFIGWSDDARAKHVNWITNNTRFLILPWVHVPHLASHILAMAMRRLNVDWQAKYGHPVYLVETFVDRSRFKGTCYRAANWICVGQTQGRSRQDRDRTLSVPVKDIHLYPLVPDFREKLCQLDP